MQKVLNFGSLNIDNVYAVDNFVRPEETLRTLGYQVFQGGKGLNQSVALALAGANVYHAGKIGPDGKSLIEVLRKNKVNTDLIDRTGSCTGHTVIQVNHEGQNCILLHGGANTEITADYVDFVLSHFAEGDLIVLQNEINQLDVIIDKAFAKGMVIALNPSPIDDALLKCDFAKITWFLLNEIEGQIITGETDPERIADALIAKYPHAKVVLTLGKLGVLYRDADGSCRHGIYRVPVVDTTAAGDTFTGYFLHCVTSGKSVAESLRLASVASSLAVSRQGASTSIPAMAEVEQAKLELMG